MENQIFIPTKLKVGYQRRSDTYSKKLAYVTYYDQKNKLRKEASWKGWIDEKQGVDEFQNEPTEGFVLNRNVGGVKESYGYHDDVRIEKVRVFDPRGFEFEIDIPNVLTILQECTSVKGKGLEGTFVYGWAGANLILIPTTSQQYKESQNYTDLQSKLVGVRLSSKASGGGGATINVSSSVGFYSNPQSPYIQNHLGKDLFRIKHFNNGPSDVYCLISNIK